MRYIALLLAVSRITCAGDAPAAKPSTLAPEIERTSLTIQAGTLEWSRGVLTFAGDAEAAALVFRNNFKLYTFERADAARKKALEEFKDATIKPEFNGWRLVIGSGIAVERYEAGLKFIGKWHESAITLFEAAWNVKRIADKQPAEVVPAPAEKTTP